MRGLSKDEVGVEPTVMKIPTKAAKRTRLVGFKNFDQIKENVKSRGEIGGKNEKIVVRKARILG